MGEKHSKHQSSAPPHSQPPTQQIQSYSYNQQQQSLPQRQPPYMQYAQYRQQPPPPLPTQSIPPLNTTTPLPPRPTTPSSTNKLSTHPSQPLHPRTPPPPPAKPLSHVGIGGVIARQQEQQEEASHTLSQAFSDLKGLMKYAADVVELADKYIAKKQRRDAAVKQESDGCDSTADQNSNDNLFDDMLRSMGISNPVTKDSAGSSFHMDLCKELSHDILPRVLPHITSMITLTDLYCIYNRARGTELISPNDLRNGVAMLDYLRLPYRMKQFENHVIVIMHRQYTENDMCNTIMKLLQSNDDNDMMKQIQHETNATRSDDNLFLQYADMQNEADGVTSSSTSTAPSLPSFASPSTNDSAYNYITAIQVSAALNSSLLLAKQQLSLCVQRQLLCCDETIDQTRYYNNEYLYPTANKMYSTSLRR